MNKEYQKATGITSIAFKTARGNYPVREFIEEQDKVVRTKIGLSIRLLINKRAENSHERIKNSH